MSDSGRNSQSLDEASMTSGDALQLDFLLDIRLEQLVRFHNELRRFMRARYREAKAADDSWIMGDLELFYEMHSRNAFLAFFSYAEEMMYQMIRHTCPTKAIDKRSGLVRFMPGLTAIGLDLGRSAAWSFFDDASAIRNCLLHANGRVSVMRDEGRKAVEHVLAKYPNALKQNSDRIRIGPKFSLRVVQSIREFRTEYVKVAHAVSLDP